MSPIFGPKPIPFGVPDPGELPLPDIGAMTRYAADTSTLIERAQQRMNRDKEQLGPLASSAVNDLLPLMASKRLVEGAVDQEAAADLMMSFALGVSIAQEEQALGWQTPKGADPRAWNALVSAGFREGGSAGESYLLRVGYFVGRHGAPGLAEVTRSLGG